MALSSARKAAVLLMSLDPPTAAELLQSAQPDMVTEIAAELTYLKQGGASEVSPEEPIKEFFSLLYQREESSGGSFVEQMLKLTFGEAKSREALAKVHERVKARDPFRDIRSMPVESIAESLAGETAQVAAIVLSELPPAKSAALLELLEEGIRPSALRCMTRGQEVSADARVRVATVMQSRLEKPAAETPGAPVPAAKAEARQDAKLRKVALLLRGLEIEPREALLKSLSDQDAETTDGVRKMMVLWEDLPVVADRPLQEGLRKIDSRQLALALVDATPVTTTKIRGSISERAKAMLDEEAELLGKPKGDEIEQARETILTALRELNATGELEFEEGED